MLIYSILVDVNTAYKHANINGSRRVPRKPIIAVVVLLIAAGATYFFLIRETTQPATSGVINASSPTTKATEKTDKGTSNETTNKTTEPSTKSNTGTNTSAKLTDAPSGTFASNHKPNLSGSPSPSEQQSTCNTLPGASCYIKFTKGSIVKTLSVQVANDEGSVIWNWDVKKAGFTEGVWQITAVANLNGQTKEASDTLNLEVGP